MFIRKFTILSLAFICIISLGWYGCSDDTITKVISIDELSVNNNSNSEIASYFPLSEGYTTIYNVTSSNGNSETVTFKAGTEVGFFGLKAVEWFSYSESGTDTGYFRVTSDAVYFYDNINSKPEKILELPIDPGHSWSKFTDVQIIELDNIDTTGIVIGLNKNEDSTSGGKGVNKTFPSTDAESMTYEGIEQLQLKSGVYYSNALKVSNSNSRSNKVNYYWYVPDIGLVKYILGATDTSYPNGDVIGELIDYGY